MRARWTVVVSFIDVQGTAVQYEDITVGPFRTRAAAERKRASLAREAIKWDQDGLEVTVQPIVPGATANGRVMGLLFGSEDAVSAALTEERNEDGTIPDAG